MWYLVVGGWHWLASTISRWSLQHGTARDVSPRLVAEDGIFRQGRNSRGGGP
jgi:hypothetical protein